MSFIPVVVIIFFVILAMYFLLNKNSDEQNKEGIVKDILQKDAFAIDFGEGRPVVVKLFGITPAGEGEMLDDKIFGFLRDSLLGHRVSVKPMSVVSAELMTAEVRTLAGEYLNAVLVRQGFARWQVGTASNDIEIADAQKTAQANQVGVWNPAIVHMLDDRRKSAESVVLSDEEIANMEVDPDEEETK